MAVTPASLKIYMNGIWKTLNRFFFYVNYNLEIYTKEPIMRLLTALS